MEPQATDIYSGSQAFTYYRHSSPTSVNPTPSGVLSGVNVFDTGVPKTANSCGLINGPAYSVLVNTLGNEIKQLEADYQNALIGAYDLLQATYVNVLLGEIASDNTLCSCQFGTIALTHCPVPLRPIIFLPHQ